MGQMRDDDGRRKADRFGCGDGGQTDEGGLCGAGGGTAAGGCGRAETQAARAGRRMPRACFSGAGRRMPRSAPFRAAERRALLARFSVYLCAALTAATLVFMLAYILVNGVPNLSKDLFALHYTSENVSVVPALVNTLVLTALSLCLAIPAGVFSAVYLTEYARKGNRFVRAVRMTAETLTGIPSVVYGLFGMLLFVGALRWGYSVMAGACTVSVMILPVIMRTTEEALLAVPDSYREGSFALGAGRLRTVFRIVLPSAAPGILSGVILAAGRVTGETAALIYTAGTVADVPDSLFGSGRTLAVHMYVLSSEGLHIRQAYATAVVLLLTVIAVNALSSFLAGKIRPA